MRANVPDTERVTIRCGARSASGAHGSPGAGDIFYDDRLTERYPHMLDEDARERIVGSARRVRHDNCDRPRRIGLRPSYPRNGRQRGSARGQMQKISAGKFHC
jgi:hypothetical protein